MRDERERERERERENEREREQKERERALTREREREHERESARAREQERERERERENARARALSRELETLEPKTAAASRGMVPPPQKGSRRDMPSRIPAMCSIANATFGFNVTDLVSVSNET